MCFRCVLHVQPSLVTGSLRFAPDKAPRHGQIALSSSGEA
jgi:hypothetical protein